MKTFFVICPIGSDDSEERKHSDRVLRYLIHPAVKAATDQHPEECVSRADSIAEPGRITRQIIEKLVEADVVIADLTGFNANVMYELGLRQGLLKPYVLLCEKNHKLPFDLADLRTVFYQLELEAIESARDELTKHILAAVNGEVSVIDRELLTESRGSGISIGETKSADFQLLEANSKILSQLENMNSLVLEIGRIVLNIQDKEEREYNRQKEMMDHQVGLQIFSQLLAQPDQLEKTLPAMQALMEFGQNIQSKSETQMPSRDTSQHKNRRSKR